MNVVTSAVMGPMTPGRRLSDAIAELVPNSLLIEHPQRQVQWEPRSTEDQAEGRAWTVASLHQKIFALEARADLHVVTHGVHAAIEGVCRVMVGGKPGMRGNGERFTGLVVHVIADGEPARTIILPLE